MEMIPIGKNAGMLWNLLESGSEFSVSQLVSKLDMTRDDLFSAIGWLAREGKYIVGNRIMNFFSVINVFKVIFISGSFRAYSLNFPSKNIIKPSLRFFLICFFSFHLW